MNSERLAIQLMIAQSVLFTAETAVIHEIGSGISITHLALIRGVAGLVLAVAFARKVGVGVIRTAQLPLQLLRGMVSLGYLWVMIYSFSSLPFADATAISYTQAAYIALFSVLILQEPVTKSRWTATAVGIAGALLIAKPTFANWNSAYLIALCGTSLNGLSFVLNRYLQRRDTDATTMFYTNFVLVLGNLPVAAMATLPAIKSCVWLPALLFFGPLGTYLGIVAVRHANASVLGPYTLLRLLISIIAGIVIFHELPDNRSTVGSIFIVLSCVLSSCALRVPEWLSRRGTRVLCPRSTVVGAAIGAGSRATAGLALTTNCTGQEMEARDDG